MPWKEQSVMSERLEFVRKAQLDGANISALSREYGISRTIAYRWIKRYASEGLSGLLDRSHRPQASPLLSDTAITEQIIEVRQTHPSWGARKIRRFLFDKNPKRRDLPALSTITEILRRNGMIEPAESLKHRAYQRFEHAEPNQLWQMDFKGEFLLGNQQPCYALGVLDDHSRYAVGLVACSDMLGVSVQAKLTRIFAEHGLPERMLMDNGPPWGSLPWGGAAASRHTRLTAWLMRLGVAITHGRPFHPQTQGKLERFNRTLEQELLARTSPSSHRAAQRDFESWRWLYNNERPHQALEMDTPASRYRSSPRPLPKRLPPIEYSDSMLVRRVQQKGIIDFQGHQLLIGRAFTGHPVGLAAGDEQGLWKAYFCQFVIADFDLRKL